MKKYATVFLINLIVHATATAKDFYVSPLGNDQWNGLVASGQQQGNNGPFQTLTRAQSAIRDLKKNGQFTEAVTVHIEGGTYFLAKPLEFDIRDTGFADRPIVWQGESGKVVLSGGIQLPGCAPAQEGRWQCATSGLNLDGIKYPNANRKKGNIPGFELFVDDQRLQLARWPNEDWAHIRLPLDAKTRFSSMEPLPAIGAGSEGLQVHIMPGNDWFDQYLGVAAIDSHRGEIGLSDVTGYPLTTGRRYYLRNSEAFLDAPGEWFYNASGGYIAFLPPAGAIPQNVVASIMQQLMIIKGASYLSMTGIALRHNNGAAISIDNAHHVLLDQIEISNVGGFAIDIKNSNQVTVSNSLIHHTGEGGIQVSGGDRKTLSASGNVIYNNHIHHFGQTVMMYEPGIEISGVGIKVSHNLIEFSPGNGLIMEGNDHLVEKNEIHHICEQASDCGAIYSGRDWTYRGNVVRYNSIHDLYGYGLQSVDVEKTKAVYVSPSPEGVRGIFLDDAVSSFIVFGNILNSAGVTPIILAGGRDSIIENNIIKTDGRAIWVDHRWDTYDWEQNRKRLLAVPYQSKVWQEKYPALAMPMRNEKWPEGNSIQRNIIIATKPNGIFLRYLMPAYSNTIANNLVWNSAGEFRVEYDVLDKLIKKNGVPWTEWIAEGIEKNSLCADPCVTFTGNIVRFCRDSPAKHIGFQELPNDIGLIE